jgi:hypothetical protein
MNAVLAGDVTMYCAPIPLGMAHFKAGKVYALGVTGTAPSPLLPDLAPVSASKSTYFACFVNAHSENQAKFD